MPPRSPAGTARANAVRCRRGGTPTRGRATRRDRGSAAMPESDPAARAAGRPLTDQPPQRLDREPHVLALGRLVDLLIADPAPAMAGDLVARLGAGDRDLGMPLERHRDAEHRERQAAPLELAQDAPHAHA